MKFLAVIIVVLIGVCLFFYLKQRQEPYCFYLDFSKYPLTDRVSGGQVKFNVGDDTDYSKITITDFTIKNAETGEIVTFDGEFPKDQPDLTSGWSLDNDQE